MPRRLYLGGDNPTVLVNCCNQALAQACAVSSPFSGSVSEMGMLRQLWPMEEAWRGSIAKTLVSLG